MRLNCSTAALIAATTIAASLPFAVSAVWAAAPDAQVAIYTADQQPAALRYKAIGQVSEQVCRKPWELRPTQAEALDALKAKARSMGANAVIGVRFDDRRLEIKSPCWQRMAAAGVAVVSAPAAN